VQCVRKPHRGKDKSTVGRSLLHATNVCWEAGTGCGEWSMVVHALVPCLEVADANFEAGVQSSQSPSAEGGRYFPDSGILDAGVRETKAPSSVHGVPG